MISESDRVISLVGSKIEEMGVTLLKELDERQVESHLTPTGMRSVATSVMQEALSTAQLNNVSQELKEIKAMLAQPSIRVAEEPLLPEPASNTVVVQGQGVHLYQWGGRFRRLPENFVIPTASHTPAMAWNLFICGKPAEGIPPLKQAPLKDCPKGSYRRYSEYLQLMHRIEAEVRAKNAWIESTSAEAAVQMYAVGKSVLKIRGHRPEEKTWTTVLKEERPKPKKKRGTRQAMEEDEEEDEDEDDSSSHDALEDASRPPKKKVAKVASLTQEDEEDE
jgi:hypothetical protein